MWLIALAGSAVVPSIFLFWYIYSRDIHPEPRGMLIGTFALGAAIAIPVVIVALLINKVTGLPPDGRWAKAGYVAFLNAAIPEGTRFSINALIVRLCRLIRSAARISSCQSPLAEAILARPTRMLRRPRCSRSMAKSGTCHEVLVPP